MTVVGGVLGGGITLLAAGQMLDEHPEAGIALLGAGTALGGALMYRVTWTRNPPPKAATRTPSLTMRLLPYATGSGAGLTLVGSTP